MNLQNTSTNERKRTTKAESTLQKYTTTMATQSLFELRSVAIWTTVVCSATDGARDVVPIVGVVTSIGSKDDPTYHNLTIAVTYYPAPHLEPFSAVLEAIVAGMQSDLPTEINDCRFMFPLSAGATQQIGNMVRAANDKWCTTIFPKQGLDPRMHGDAA